MAINLSVGNYRLRKISHVAILKFEFRATWHEFIIENHASETINKIT